MRSDFIRGACGHRGEGARLLSLGRGGCRAAGVCRWALGCMSASRHQRQQNGDREYKTPLAGGGSHASS